MTRLSTPVTGDVWLADLDPVRGSEQAGRRTAIIFQNPVVSVFTSTFLAVPTTTNLARRGLSGTCFIPADDGGLDADSIALAFQARTLDRSRLRRRFGRLSDESLDALADAILTAFGIEVAP